ncbi:MlaC/ttg2D family ABC transporter substrate-binding protein [Candidatus Deianiraea vastatrix]|uniref:Toluene tolerance-like ABC transporter protein n=1 Tax=Candidatus Deianiraea vastatrix TaxID=2163644 RepID=A0A5B8XDA8_9RICK|nr:ABC transporter substrate-binding protein [Candidatus Deianiraea vastatrix]QED23263.1 Putative toluene tolerance-like ABC transporter protein [Candidatus Deianiraea vastatrix]
MKKILFSFLLLIFFAQGNVLASESNPRDYVVKIANDIFAVVSNKKISIENQRKMLVENFIDEIDFNWNARAASGIYWRQMNEEQRGDFVKYYKNFLIKIWMPKFSGYKDEKYSVLEKYETMDNGDFIVNVEIVKHDGIKINLSFRVRKFDDKFKILNVIAEGVDMARTYNIQFTEYADKHGLEALLDYVKTGKSKDLSKSK